MKQLLLFSAISLLLATSCTKKAKQTTINGQVRTYGTEEAIRHTPVKVQIVERIPGGLGSGPGFHQLAATWTDQNGFYTLSHKLYEDVNYFIAVDEETVKENQGYLPPSNPERERHRITQVGGTFTKNYYLSAYGWVKFNISITNHSSNDYFAYNIGGGGSERFYGNISTYRIWDFGGNITHDAAFTTFINGEYTLWQDQIFVPAFDTINYEIKL